MIYIVDGTGEKSDGAYSQAMANSHCSTIFNLNRTNAFYHRGPDTLDVFKSTAGIVARVHDKLLGNEFPAALLAPGARQLPRTPIILVGYSRGGAAVVMVARLLAERHIPVEAMFLFDAVSRRSSSSIDVDMVPANVRRCRHAVRNEGAQVVMEVEEKALWKKCGQASGYKEVAGEFARVGSGRFEDFLLSRSRTLAARHPELSRAVAAWAIKSSALNGLKVAMRNSFELGTGASGPSIPFGNCARRAESGCDYQEQGFAGTHAALGGVPWTTLGREVEQMDRDISGRVWTWMSGHMLQSGVHARKT